jgi:hypothetical protein
VRGGEGAGGDGVKSPKKRDLPESEKQILVGTFRLCDVNVDLYGWQGVTGGWFFMAPDETSRPRLKVGLAVDSWWKCVATVMHEVVEAAAVMHRVRYYPANDASGENGLYQFVMTHSQFAEVVAEAAYFLTDALPKLAKVYNREHRK